MPKTLAEKSRQRFQFLKAAYDATDGNRQGAIEMWDLGASLGFDREETDNIFEYLEGEGLIETAFLGGGISITHRGIVEVEQAERMPQQPTQHFPANIINIHGDVTGAAFQVGNTNSTQTANITISGQDVESLKAWLDKLKENVPALGLSSESTQAMSRHVASLESETQEEKPDKGVLRTQLGRIQNLLKSVATHMVADALLKELPTLMQHLNL